MPATVILTQPISKSVLFGQITETLVVVPGAEQGNISYQWQSGLLADGSDLVDIVDATADTFVIPVDSAVGTKYYACKVDSDVAETTETVSSLAAVVVVLPVVTITVQPASEVVAGGEDPTALSVTATTQDDDPIAYQWYSCDDALKTDPVAVSGAVTNELTIGTLEPGYDYFYFCRLKTADSIAIDSTVAKITQNGIVAKLAAGADITNEYVNDYIAQCSAEAQARFLALQAETGIVIPATFEGVANLRTAQIELFMSAI